MNKDKEYEKLFRKMNDINKSQDWKEKEYKKYKDDYKLYLIISVVQMVPYTIIWIMIGLFNYYCGGKKGSCDGNSCVSCTPSEAPVFFTILFIWTAEILFFLVLMIKNRIRMKEIEESM